MQASMEFKLPAQVRKKEKWFISSCNLLDVHSQGHTREQAERNLKDARDFSAQLLRTRNAGSRAGRGEPRTRPAARVILSEAAGAKNLGGRSGVRHLTFAVAGRLTCCSPNVVSSKAPGSLGYARDDTIKRRHKVSRPGFVMWSRTLTYRPRCGRPPLP
jgi:predicted RNase H-like HicB family nuclease